MDLINFPSFLKEFTSSFKLNLTPFNFKYLNKFFMNNSGVLCASLSYQYAPATSIGDSGWILNISSFENCFTLIPRSFAQFTTSASSLSAFDVLYAMSSPLDSK